MRPSSQAQAVNLNTIEEPHIILKRLNENCRRYIYYLPYIIPLFQKSNRLIYNNGLIVKRITNQADDIILDVCMKFENYPIKTVGEDAFCS